MIEQWQPLHQFCVIAHEKGSANGPAGRYKKKEVELTISNPCITQNREIANNGNYREYQAYSCVTCFFTALVPRRRLFHAHVYDGEICYVYDIQASLHISQYIQILLEMI